MSYAWAYTRAMNQINRLEETWSPAWDLSLQEEFGFCASAEASKTEVRAAAPSAPSLSWSLTTREVLNRQAALERRIAAEASTYEDFVAYFENLFSREG